MKKFIVVILAVLVAAGFLTACNDSSQSTQTPPARNSGEDRPRQNEPATPANFTIRFSNNSDYQINELYISSSAASDWGSDLLGSRVLEPMSFTNVSIPVYSSDNYDIRVKDADGDDYSMMAVALWDGFEVILYWGSNGYAADLFDSNMDYVDTIYGVRNEANNTGSAGGAGDATGQFDPSSYTVPSDSPFDSNILISDLGMLVPYPSEAFYILGSDDHYVMLASYDNEAVLEVWLQEQWVDANASIDYYQDKLIMFTEQAINARMLNATDIQWYEVDVVRTDYGNTASISSVVNQAEYTLDGERARTLCRAGRWIKVSDQSSYYYIIVFTSTADSYDFYLDNYYYKFRDSLMDY